MASINGNQSAGQISLQAAIPYNASGTVIRTLPAYPYPMVPLFNGNGDINDGRNYVPVLRSNITSQNDFRWLGQDLFGPLS